MNFNLLYRTVISNMRMLYIFRSCAHIILNLLPWEDVSYLKKNTFNNVFIFDFQHEVLGKILVMYPVINNSVVSVRMTGRWQSVAFRCSVRREDIWESHKKQIEVIDFRNRLVCDSVVRRWRGETNHRRAHRTVPLCRSVSHPCMTKGEWWYETEELVWKRGLIKAVRERVSRAVSQHWLSSAWLIRLGWCDKQSWISQRGFHWA